MEMKRVDAFLMKLLFLTEAGIIVTQVLNLDSITSMLFLLTFPVTVLLWLRSVRRTVTESDMIMIVAAVFAVVCVLINAVGANAQVSFDYLKKLIMFVMSLLFLQTAYRTQVDEKTYELIRKIVDLLVVFLIAMYFLEYGAMHTMNGKRTIYLTFRFSNPNMTAIFLTSLMMLKMHRLFERTRWYVKAFHLLQLLLMTWFVVETQSRNCLLVLAVYTVLSLWLVFRIRRKLRITRNWAVMFAWLPAVLVVGYMLLINNQWVQETLSFLVGEGKGLDSRVAVWGPALEALGKSPVTGAYYEISNGTGTSQMHNTHMDIAASYGVPVLILVCVLLFKYLWQNDRIYTDKESYIYIIGFACMVILGMGEAAIFSGGLGVYILAGTSLLMAGRRRA